MTAPHNKRFWHVFLNYLDVIFAAIFMAALLLLAYIHRDNGSAVQKILGLF